MKIGERTLLQVAALYNIAVNVTTRRDPLSTGPPVKPFKNLTGE